MEELGENGLRIYTFPTDDATVADTNNKMNVSVKPVYMYKMLLICARNKFHLLWLAPGKR